MTFHAPPCILKLLTSTLSTVPSRTGVQDVNTLHQSLFALRHGADAIMWNSLTSVATARVLCSSAITVRSNFILFVPRGFTRYCCSFYKRLFCTQRNTAVSAAHECRQEVTTLLGCGAVAMCVIANISKRLSRPNPPKNGLKVGNFPHRNEVTHLEQHWTSSNNAVTTNSNRFFADNSSCVTHHAPSRNCLRSLLKLRHVWLTVLVEQLGSHRPDFHEILYLRIFRKSAEKIQCSLKFDNNNGHSTWRPTFIYDHMSFCSS